ncbi:MULTISPECIES: transposase [unclassified Streptomyces]|uniref:transposase n=1 Tax=unclassified Streptomyces TaxID=2593676 RepID=UPI0036FF8632
MAQATHMTLRMLAERVEQLTGQINELNQRLTQLVEHHAPQLLVPVGIGPDSAVTLLITMGDDPERLNTEASFAALRGVSPVEYASGRRRTRRWVVERMMSWLNGCRRLYPRYDAQGRTFMAFVGIASRLIGYRQCSAGVLGVVG